MKRFEFSLYRYNGNTGILIDTYGMRVRAGSLGQAWSQAWAKKSLLERQVSESRVTIDRVH